MFNRFPVNPKIWKCDTCSITFTRKIKLEDHKRSLHHLLQQQQEDPEVALGNSNAAAVISQRIQQDEDMDIDMPVSEYVSG